MYFLQFALLYALFYLAYYLGLSKTGQLTANRYYLLSIYLITLLLPFIPWPTLAVLPEVIPATSFMSTDAATPLLSTATETATPVGAVNENGIYPIDWWQILVAVYVVGAVIFLIRYALQLWSLHRLISNSVINDQQYWPGEVVTKVVPAHKNTAFTYGRCFYVSPDILASSDAELIMEHEYAHAKQLHTIDLTVSEIFTALLWWHPLAWLHRRDLRLNLEFLADRAVLNAGYPLKNYQLSLLRFCESFIARPALTFSHSPLKTRLIMMKSKQRSTSVYFTLLTSIILISGLVSACSTQEAAVPTEATETASVPFVKTFTGQNGWEQARSLLTNNYPNHQINYFVNGSPAQNEIIPKPEDVKTVEVAANTETVGTTHVSFTTQQNDWVSALGWHAAEEKSRHETEDYNDWTFNLLSEEKLTCRVAMTFYGGSEVIQTSMDYLNTEYPNAAVTFYLDGSPIEIDALATPEEDIKAIVIAHTQSDKKQAIFHIITA